MYLVDIRFFDFKSYKTVSRVKNNIFSMNVAVQNNILLMAYTICYTRTICQLSDIKSNKKNIYQVMIDLVLQ